MCGGGARILSIRAESLRIETVAGGCSPGGRTIDGGRKRQRDAPISNGRMYDLFFIFVGMERWGKLIKVGGGGGGWLKGEGREGLI